jgi:hypothetical protein
VVLGLVTSRYLLQADGIKPAAGDGIKPYIATCFVWYLTLHDFPGCSLEIFSAHIEDVRHRHIHQLVGHDVISGRLVGPECGAAELS